jgi:ubiquinone/menaquinone biosynthesis C-methylase UbiE
MTDWENLPWLYRLIDNTVNLFFSSVYSRYIRTLGLTGTERVLDFGSGSGIGARHLAALLKRGGHLTCVDTSRSLTAKARRRLRRYPNVDFRVGELPALALPGGSYQVVFIHYVLHELPRRPGPPT